MENQEKIKNIFEAAIKKGASDIHLTANHLPVMRVARELVDMAKEEFLTNDETKEIAAYLMQKEQWENFLKDKEIDFGYEFDGKSRYRVNAYFEKGNISIALRAVTEKIRTIEELGLPSILHKITESTQGFVLITGASSQGKSTTLAAIVDEINHQRRAHIITIEDPVEYIFKEDKCLIGQREVGKDTKSFAKALRAALREDPDVIMVGEMRDLETISTALTAAETGHLVLATLHTNSASQTIHRIIDVFPPHQQNQIRAQLSSSLLAVVSQKLVLTTKKDILPVCEIMFNNSAVANLIRENKVHEIPTIIETSADSGMVSFNKAFSELVAEKKITKEMALKNSFNPTDLESRLGGRG